MKMNFKVGNEKPKNPAGLRLLNVKHFFSKYRVNKLLVLTVLVIALPVVIFAANRITKYLTKAVGEQVIVSFQPSSLTLPPNSTVRIFVDAKTNSIGFARIVFSFDNTKIRLAGEVDTTAALGKVIEKTSMTEANSAGRVIIILAPLPDTQPPTGMFEFARFPLQVVTSQQNTTTTLNFATSDMQIVEKSVIILPVSATQLTVSLNPVVLTPTSTPGPTNIPTSTPTISPSPSLSTLTFTPTDDAAICEDYPSRNYGLARTLRLDNTPKCQYLIKFNITGTGGKAIKSAKLRLYNTQGSDSGGRFYETGNSWNQRLVTWSNAPSATSFITSLGIVKAGVWYEADLTGMVTGEDTYSLRVSTNSSDGAYFSSKEGSNPPQLIVTLE